MTARLITLTGDNFFALKKDLNQIIANYEPNAVERLDAGEITAPQFTQTLALASLFAPERLVILNNPSSNTEVLNAITDVNVPEGTTLVIVEQAFDARTKTYKFLKKSSDFRQFGQIEGSQLLNWVQKEVEKLGGKISPEITRYLIARAGGDQWRLSLELEKLVSWNTQITRDSVDQLVELGLVGSAFELLDAAFAGDRAKVNKLINVLKVNEDPYKLIGLITSQVYALALVVTAGNKSQAEIAKESGVHPFVLGKLGGRAAKTNLPKLRELANKVADIDFRLKTTSADPWLALVVLLGDF